jgi:hypothetical protein
MRPLSLADDGGAKFFNSLTVSPSSSFSFRALIRALEIVADVERADDGAEPRALLRAE